MEAAQLEQLYRQMFCRKSLRAYAAQPMSRDALEPLLDIAAWAPELPGLSVPRGAVALLPDGAPGGLFSIKAPQYALYLGADDEHNQLLAGYALQMLSLRLSAMGIGSCFLGGARLPRQQAAQFAQGLVIMMALGAPSESGGHLREASGFKRKPLTAIAPLGCDAALLEPVRLAPSAMNQQSWRFLKREGGYDCYIDGSGLMQRFMHRLCVIDMGIALCHMHIAALQTGHALSLSRETVAAPKGLTYVATARLSPAPKEAN